MSRLEEIRERLYEIDAIAQVMATALGTLEASDFPGGYSTCYAITRLAKQAEALVEAEELAAREATP